MTNKPGNNRCIAVADLRIQTAKDKGRYQSHLLVAPEVRFLEVGSDPLRPGLRANWKLNNSQRPRSLEHECAARVVYHSASPTVYTDCIFCLNVSSMNSAGWMICSVTATTM